MRNTLLVICVVLTGCSQEQANLYCDNHADVHTEHRGEVAQLQAHYNGTGQLTAELSIPKKTLSGDIDTLLAAENVLVVKSQRICPQEELEIKHEDEAVVANYRFDCGAGKQLKKVDIALLDHLPGLDEVEVNVQTHAVNKHFIINRQCKKPIFSI